MTQNIVPKQQMSSSGQEVEGFRLAKSISTLKPCRAVVPNHRVTTHYRAVEEFLPGREKVLGKMCIDMTLC